MRPRGADASLTGRSGMRKLVIGALTAGAVVAGSGTALAAPPEVSKKACDADQGVFAQDHGVKSCTTTAIETRTFTATLPRRTFSVSLQGFDLVSVDLTGTAEETADFLVTTV